MIPKIYNLAELRAFMGTENIGRELYKWTECGIVYAEEPDGIMVCGYAEGADAECSPIRLKYPFTPSEFWEAVEAADLEGCALWRAWNLPDEDDS